MKYLVMLALLAVACGSTPRQVLATDYDATCTVPADCTIIHVGACTDACGYPSDYAAINSKDAARAEQDYRALDCAKGTSSTCRPVATPKGVTCNDGQCGLLD